MAFSININWAMCPCGGSGQLAININQMASRKHEVKKIRGGLGTYTGKVGGAREVRRDTASQRREGGGAGADDEREPGFSILRRSENYLGIIMFQRVFNQFQ